MLFVWPRQNINHGLQNLKVIYKKCCLFYAIIYYHAILDKWTEKRKEVGEANSSSLKVLLEYTGNVHFCTICEIIFLVGGPWKYNVVLEESLKSGCLCLYEPWPSPHELHNWLCFSPTLPSLTFYGLLLRASPGSVIHVFLFYPFKPQYPHANSPYWSPYIFLKN